MLRICKNGCFVYFHRSGVYKRLNPTARFPVTFYLDYELKKQTYILVDE